MHFHSFFFKFNSVQLNTFLISNTIYYCKFSAYCFKDMFKTNTIHPLVHSVQIGSCLGFSFVAEGHVHSEFISRLHPVLFTQSGESSGGILQQQPNPINFVTRSTCDLTLILDQWGGLLHHSSASSSSRLAQVYSTVVRTGASSHTSITSPSPAPSASQSSAAVV